MKHLRFALALLLAACTSSVKVGPETVAGLTPVGTARRRRAVSTLCGGNGLTVFYGMAKPVRAQTSRLRRLPCIALKA